jgi:hypothetical protein
MLKLMREWGFPAGLGTLWVIALVYTLHSVSRLPHQQPRRESASRTSNS